MTIQKKILHEDLDKLSDEFPNQVFIFGNGPDEYLERPLNYWGKGITFVSIQDYQLWLKGESVLFSKTFAPKSNIQNRREIWISGGISKNSGDNVDYASIKYALSNDDELSLDGFKLVKQYKTLNLFEKEE